MKESIVDRLSKEAMWLTIGMVVFLVLIVIADHYGF